MEALDAGHGRGGVLWLLCGKRARWVCEDAGDWVVVDNMPPVGNVGTPGARQPRGGGGGGWDGIVRRRGSNGLSTVRQGYSRSKLE